jgi:hypothetical protein
VTCLFYSGIYLLSVLVLVVWGLGPSPPLLRFFLWPCLCPCVRFAILTKLTTTPAADGRAAYLTGFSFCVCFVPCSVLYMGLIQFVCARVCAAAAWRPQTFSVCARRRGQPSQLHDVTIPTDASLSHCQPVVSRCVISTLRVVDYAVLLVDSILFCRVLWKWYSCLFLDVAG